MAEQYDFERLVGLENGEAYLYPGRLRINTFLLVLDDLIQHWDLDVDYHRLSDWDVYHGYVVVDKDDGAGMRIYTFCDSDTENAEVFTVMMTKSYRRKKGWSLA